MRPLAEILELARWAPSGDNTQPWRFAIEADDRIVVYGHDTRDHCVYDLDGHASHVSHGALLETMALAATRFGLAAQVSRRNDSPDERPVFDVQFRADPGIREDPLVACIRERRVQRRAMRTRPLAAGERLELDRSVEPHHRLVWFDSLTARSRVAWLNFRNAKLRLTIPEAYRVHRDVIEWNATSSDWGIPDAGLGASPVTLMLMRWAMASWERVAFMNRYLAGTFVPRIEMDLVPGLACAAHCVLVAQEAPQALDDYVAAGRALQRFWLTATRLRLQFQPEYTPLVFARFARSAVRFAASGHAAPLAEQVRAGLERLLGNEVASCAVFMGRIGNGPPAAARSARLPLDKLLAPASADRSAGG